MSRPSVQLDTLPWPEDEEHPYYGSWFLKGSGVFDAEEALIKFMATHELT